MSQDTPGLRKNTDQIKGSEGFWHLIFQDSGGLIIMQPCLTPPSSLLGLWSVYRHSLASSRWAKGPQTLHKALTTTIKVNSDLFPQVYQCTTSAIFGVFFPTSVIVVTCCFFCNRDDGSPLPPTVTGMCGRVPTPAKSVGQAGKVHSTLAWCLTQGCWGQRHHLNEKQTANLFVDLVRPSKFNWDGSVK